MVTRTPCLQEKGRQDGNGGENLKIGERIKLERDGIFIFVGLVPNSSFLKDVPLASLQLHKVNSVQKTGLFFSSNNEV